MSRKYIKQIDNLDFVFPNNNLAEYDVEIIHDLNENSVEGSISGFTSNISGGNLVFSFNYNWNLNGAEPFIDASGHLHILSVHMMEPSLTYYKPWRCVTGITTSNTTISSTGGTVNCTVTPSMMQVTGFTNGTYQFEVRMIGKRAIFPICYSTNDVVPTPSPTPTQTPTPTPTSVGPTPTPTPTPTVGPTPTPTTTYTIITPIAGQCYKVGATACDNIGSLPSIYLDPTDLAIYTANGGCLSDGAGSNVSVIRNSDGTPISGTFYFVWNIGTCSTTTFKSTNGNLTERPTQC